MRVADCRGIGVADTPEKVRVPFSPIKDSVQWSRLRSQQ